MLAWGINIIARDSGLVPAKGGGKSTCEPTLLVALETKYTNPVETRAH